MIGIWLSGLLRRRLGRLLAAAFGIAVAVALVAGLGSFFSASKATMTARTTASVPVDWQVQLDPHIAGGDPTAVTALIKKAPGTLAALPVGFADSPGFKATTQGTNQTTGAGKVLGLPPSYISTFPLEIRKLTGTLNGALVAQQTAANLHVQAGDTVRIGRAGLKPFEVKIAGVVELPRADALFQKVGAPPASQPIAPPDNVILLPSADFATNYSTLAAARPDLVTHQIHVKRSHILQPDPSSAYVTATGQAHNLEAATSGAGIVGDNLGVALGAAREDALYSQVLFLFLAAPGALLAAALTAAVANAGTARRRTEQALLRARGTTQGQLLKLVVIEGLVIGILGGAVGLLAARAIGYFSFGSAQFGASASASWLWAGMSFLIGLGVAAAVIVLPAYRDLNRKPDQRQESRRPRWMSYGLDFILLAVALAIFWAAGRNKYTLVLAPEGVPTISVSYWAFLAPALGWIGAGLLSWRLADLLLGPGRRLLTRVISPFAGNLAMTTTAMLSRQRRLVARSAVLIGLALSFAISTATFDATYQQQAEADAQLTNGADVTVTESPGTSTPPDYAKKLAAVPGVQAVEPLQHRLAYVGTDLQDLYGINPTTITKATTLQDPYFTGGTSAELMKRLAARKDGVLVSAETVNDFQLAPGDTLRLRLQNEVTHVYSVVTFHYVGIVNEFPTAPKDSFMVANATYVAAQTHSDAVGTFLVSTGGGSVNAVADSVRKQVSTSGSVATINDSRGLVGSSLTSVDLSGLTRLELSFAIVIAMAAGGLLMGLGLNERRRSMAIASALGASRRQLRVLSAVEPLFVTIVGVLCGAATGWGLSYLLVKVLTGVFDPPPSSLAVPWVYVVATALAIAVSIAAAAAWVARRSRVRAREFLRAL